MLATELTSNKVNCFLQYRMHKEVGFLSVEGDANYSFFFQMHWKFLGQKSLLKPLMRL